MQRVRLRSWFVVAFPWILSRRILGSLICIEDSSKMLKTIATLVVAGTLVCVDAFTAPRLAVRSGSPAHASAITGHKLSLRRYGNPEEVVIFVENIKIRIPLSACMFVGLNLP